MSGGDTRTLIARAVEQLLSDVPALARLQLVARLELRAHGRDAPIWRVAVPGPTVSRDPASDARVDVSIGRSDFNQLASEGRLADWAHAYGRGAVRVSGDPGVVKLVGKVIERRLTRSGT